MKKLDFTRILFLITSSLILIAGFVIPNTSIVTSIIGALIIVCLVVLDIQTPRITKLSEDNPKIKTVRFLNRLTIFIVILFSIFNLLLPIKTLFNFKNGEILMVGLISIFMMIFGNLSPKIPFNRYLGLRLPWTIRDEQTWRLAHKIVGYSSFPIALMMFVLAFFFYNEKVVTIGVLTWIVIPSAYSFLFYYKKIKGISI